MSIPKKIHYCWFGRGNMPKLVLKCINSWKEKLPDYELVLWNEDNFDININQYVKEAYEMKKYAFVTDFVRLYALYNYGGVYMDTDVEVLKSLDIFLEHGAFTGCESENMCVTGTIGSEEKHPWIEKLLNNYKNKKFISQNGELDTTSNTQMITGLTAKEYGWLPENKYQILKDDLHIYPYDFFCAKDWHMGEVTITDQTYTVHYFSSSWISKSDKLKDKMIRTLGPNLTKIIVRQKKAVKSLMKRNIQ